MIIAFLGILISISVFGTDSFSQEHGRERHHGPPPKAYCACEGKNAGDKAELVGPHGGTVTGTCEQEPNNDRLVLWPDNPPEGDSGGRPEKNDRD